MTDEALFCGFSNAVLPVESFDLGHGLVLRPTYAHLMSPMLMAFSPAQPGRPHSAPWRAAKGGAGYDIHVELAIERGELPGGLSVKETAWWIAALLRLAHFPFLTMPVLSDQSFSAAAHSSTEPNLQPFETEPRILGVRGAELPELGTDHLEWVKSKWPQGAALFSSNSDFRLAMRAFDGCTVQGRTSSSLLTVWGALEQLFAPSRHELAFRISANIAAYLEPVGPRRLALFRQVKKLYGERSAAAHSAKDTDHGPLIESFVLMRNALVRMVDENSVPSKTRFEELIFCGGAVGET